MEIKKQIGDRINAALSKRNKRQKDLAEELKISANTVSYFCTGSRTPNMEQLIHIANYLEVSTDFLLCRTDDPEISPTATDELGLTSGAVNWIKQKGSDSIFGKEFCYIFSKLLEMKDFQILIDSLLDFAAATYANTLDVKCYQHAYHNYPDDIINRHKMWEHSISQVIKDKSLSPRVRLFVEANEELGRIDEKYAAFGAIWGSGEDIGFRTNMGGLQGITEARTIKLITNVLLKIEEIYGIECLKYGGNIWHTSND